MELHVVMLRCQREATYLGRNGSSLDRFAYEAMSSHRPLVKRGLPWRLSSSLVTGLAGAVSRAFLYGLNNVETTGLDNFLKLLDDRVAGQHKQGLLTGMLLKKIVLVAADEP